MIYFSIGA